MNKTAFSHANRSKDYGPWTKNESGYQSTKKPAQILVKSTADPRDHFELTGSRQFRTTTLTGLTIHLRDDFADPKT
jgi:hypothetical protein